MTLVCPRLSRLFGALVGVLLLTSGLTGAEPPDLPKPAAAKADEPLAKKSCHSPKGLSFWTAPPCSGPRPKAAPVATPVTRS